VKKLGAILKVRLYDFGDFLFLGNDIARRKNPYEKSKAQNHHTFSDSVYLFIIIG